MNHMGRDNFMISHQTHIHTCRQTVLFLVPRPLILSHILLPMCIILSELLDTSQSPLDALLVHDLVEAEHADDGADAAHHGAARHEDLLAAARQPVTPGSR